MSFGLTNVGPLKQLNGDLRALILVSSTRSELLTEPLSTALKALKTRVVTFLASVKAKDEDDQKDSKDEAEETGDAGSTPQKKRRQSEEATSTSQQQPPMKMPSSLKLKDENTKWKDAMVMFQCTLNLLIGMCESALSNSSESKASSDEKAETLSDKDNTESDKNNDDDHKADGPSSSSSK